MQYGQESAAMACYSRMRLGVLQYSSSLKLGVTGPDCGARGSDRVIAAASGVASAWRSSLSALVIFLRVAMNFHGRIV